MPRVTTNGVCSPRPTQVLATDPDAACAQNEFLQAQLDQTRIHLRSAERDRDAYLTELNTAQSRIDRLQSRILHPSLKSEASTDSKSTLNGAKESSPSRSSTPHVKVENDRSVSASPFPHRLILLSKLPLSRMLRLPYSRVYQAMLPLPPRRTLTSKLRISGLRTNVYWIACQSYVPS